MKCSLTFTESILESTGQVLQVSHASSACCLPSDGLHTPVVCSNEAESVHIINTYSCQNRSRNALVLQALWVCPICHRHTFKNKPHPVARAIGSAAQCPGCYIVSITSGSLLFFADVMKYGSKKYGSRRIAKLPFRSFCIERHMQCTRCQTIILHSFRELWHALLANNSDQTILATSTLPNVGRMEIGPYTF